MPRGAPRQSLRRPADQHMVPVTTQVILSYHDFQQTPSAAVLSQLAAAMRKVGDRAFRANGTGSSQCVELCGAAIQRSVAVCG